MKLPSLSPARRRALLCPLLVADVRNLLGTPEFTDVTQGKAGEVRARRYRTRHLHGDGDATRDETTPLLFLDGKLRGVGDAAWQQALVD